jgi:hypothetical protein
MRFLRQALVITPGLSVMPANKKLHATQGDVALDVERVTVESVPKDDWLLVRASVPMVTRPTINANHEVEIDEALRQRVERSIESFADMVAVAKRSARSVSSPHPWAALVDLSDEERDYLAQAVRFASHRAAIRHRVVDAIGLDDPSLIQLGTDRPDGVALMAEGLSSTHETGQFHEYIRVFERAFACGPFDLIEPLARFLEGVREMGYTQGEVNEWLAVLRNLATHADRRAEFATASDINPVVWRVEQAAYDVLFNKKTWRSPDIERRSLYKWRSLVGRDRLVFTQGTTPAITAQLLDGFGTFPAYFGGLTTIPSDWWIGVAEDETDGSVSQQSHPEQSI